MSFFPSPFHSHILTLRNFSQHFQTYLQRPISRCVFCREDIDGSSSIYCCEKCEFYIHTSCARAPLQILHTRHPHPLDLQFHDDFNFFNYECVEFKSGCNFDVDIDDVMKTLLVEKYYYSILREPRDGESRLQFAHEHPLTAFPVRTRIFCRGCEMQISEEAYGCSECNFFLHEACAKAPLKIEHHPLQPRHPLYLSYDASSSVRCHACRSWCPIRYRCEKSEFIFDLSCVISTMPCEDDDDEREDIRGRPSVMDHSLHPHQLSSYHSKTQTKIKCQICEGRIPSGDFFGCSDCSFFLHESCAPPPTKSIQRHLHPEHTLTFAQFRNETEHECPLCESPIRRDSHCYACQECDLFIHPACASATLSDLEKGVGMTVQYSFHEHELKLFCNLDRFENCTACDGTIQDKTPRYKCNSKECSFNLHISCVQKPHNLIHPAHSLHPLTLGFKPPNEDIECRCCYTTISGLLSFGCGDCNFYLHVACAQMPTLKHPFHEHDLFYLGNAKTNFLACNACSRSCNVDLFRCARCDFNLHYRCSQLLPTIKCEHHGDPLVLRESFIEDDFGEYYCDICERRRDPKKWVYFCETANCLYVAHVDCALSPVKLEVIEEDDFIKQKEDIQRREKEIELTQERVDAKEASLRPLMAELASMRAELESQRAGLKELKTEHAKWIDIEVIKEDKSIGGGEDACNTDGESGEAEEDEDTGYQFLMRF